MNYEQASDPEINFKVAEARGSSGWCSMHGWVLHKNERFDPCNNPSDAWPIIQELLSTGSIVLDKEGNALWFKDKPLGHSHHATGGTLRALMIVFLMMQSA